MHGNNSRIVRFAGATGLIPDSGAINPGTRPGVTLPGAPEEFYSMVFELTRKYEQRACQKLVFWEGFLGWIQSSHSGFICHLFWELFLPLHVCCFGQAPLQKAKVESPESEA